MHTAWEDSAARILWNNDIKIFFKQFAKDIYSYKAKIPLFWEIEGDKKSLCPSPSCSFEHTYIDTMYEKSTGTKQPGYFLECIKNRILT